ncbi:MAG TPA: SCP2 sterol-binding domain-containing protein [Polyangiaceae bacterium]|jgi:hypothetical protein
MSDVPSSPAAFFTKYLPDRLAAVELPQASSVGSVVFSVPGSGSFSFRLVTGKLEVESAARSDAIVTVTIPAESFETLVVRGVALLEAHHVDPQRQLLAFRALSLDSERAKLIRGVQGTVAFAVVDGDVTHRAYVTPGAASANVSRPECEVACDASVFWDLQSGKQNAFELLMAGKLRISGDAQIPMAMSSLFA